MSLQTLCYLEYFCAFLTAICFSLWGHYFLRGTFSHPWREAGPKLHKIRKTHIVPLRSLAFASMPFLLLLVNLGMYFGIDVIMPPLSLVSIIMLAFAAFSIYYFDRVSIEVHEKGLIIFNKWRYPYLTWQEIDHCQWMKSANQLLIEANQSIYTIPITNADFEKTLATLGRYVEVHDEQGEILCGGLPKASANESETNKSARNSTRTPIQFSILSILMLMVVVAAASGWYAVTQEYKRIQQQALDALNAGSVTFDQLGAVRTLDFMPPVTNPQSWPPVNRRKISDQDLVLLKSLHRLKRLYLTCTDITDAAIPDLITMQSLESLSLGSTKITPAGIERLKREMPHTEIKH